MVDKLKLKAEVVDPGKDFYERNKAKGLDYNYYGNWQTNYGKFVIPVSNVLAKTQKGTLSMLDVGTACGVNLLGIKLTGVFKKVVGVDNSPFMINLGKKTHGFTDEELMVLDAREVAEYFEPESFDLIHCSQMLEHIPEDEIVDVLRGFSNILTSVGVIMLVVDSVTPGQSAEELKEKEETHVTVKPRKWWQDKINSVFRLDSATQQRFASVKISPDNSPKTFFDYYNNQWSVFVGSKK
jgi:cyclopropane fatty-acyl-phospholipid synthase-like methyltransferase